MISILVSPEQYVSVLVIIVGILSLAGLGAMSGYFAGISKIKGSLHVAIWGIIAMGFATWIGSLFNVSPI